jgi:hypothetical protein
MIYTSNNKSFKEHVHPRLQKRIRIFLMMGIIMFLVGAYDVINGVITLPVALMAVTVGGFVGWFTSRIFLLTWNHDGERVVGRIDTIGWFVLSAYILFEIARAVLFETVVHIGTSSATAITFAVVSSALISRAMGLRGKILEILKEERIFG